MAIEVEVQMPDYASRTGTRSAYHRVKEQKSFWSLFKRNSAQDTWDQARRRCADSDEESLLRTPPNEDSWKKDFAIR